MVATTSSDAVNTHVAFTVRELTEDGTDRRHGRRPGLRPTSSNWPAAPGCCRYAEMLGQSLAPAHARERCQGARRWVATASCRSPRPRPPALPMVGKTLEEIGLFAGALV